MYNHRTSVHTLFYFISNKICVWSSITGGPRYLQFCFSQLLLFADQKTGENHKLRTKWKPNLRWNRWFWYLQISKTKLVSNHITLAYTSVSQPVSRVYLNHNFGYVFLHLCVALNIFFTKIVCFELNKVKKHWFVYAGSCDKRVKSGKPVWNFVFYILTYSLLCRSTFNTLKFASFFFVKIQL